MTNDLKTKHQKCNFIQDMFKINTYQGDKFFCCYSEYPLKRPSH